MAAIITRLPDNITVIVIIRASSFSATVLVDITDLNARIQRLARCAEIGNEEPGEACRLNLHPKLTAYTTSAGRKSDFATLLNATRQHFDDGVADEDLKKELSYYSTINEAISSYRASAYSLYLLATIPPKVWEKSYSHRYEGKRTANDKKVRYARQGLWHNFTVVIWAREVGVCDSCF